MHVRAEEYVASSLRPLPTPMHVRAEEYVASALRPLPTLCVRAEGYDTHVEEKQSTVTLSILKFFFFRLNQ